MLTCSVEQRKYMEARGGTSLGVLAQKSGTSMATGQRSWRVSKGSQLRRAILLILRPRFEYKRAVSKEVFWYKTADLRSNIACARAFAFRSACSDVPPDPGFCHDYCLKAPICKAQAEEAVAVALAGPVVGAILSSVRLPLKLDLTVKPGPAVAVPVTQ
jgi:hypothetical protein